MLGPPHAGPGLAHPHSRLGSGRRQPARCQAATCGSVNRAGSGFGENQWEPDKISRAGGSDALVRNNLPGRPNRFFKGNLIAGGFRVARRIAVARKTALFAMQNKPVFDVRKSTATSRETQGETGFRSEPRTTVVAQKYCILFFPRPPRRIFPKNEQERSKVRFFQGVNLIAN